MAASNGSVIYFQGKFKLLLLEVGVNAGQNKTTDVPLYVPCNRIWNLS